MDPWEQRNKTVIMWLWCCKNSCYIKNYANHNIMIKIAKMIPVDLTKPVRIHDIPSFFTIYSSGRICYPVFSNITINEIETDTILPTLIYSPCERCKNCNQSTKQSAFTKHCSLSFEQLSIPFRRQFTFPQRNNLFRSIKGLGANRNKKLIPDRATWASIHP